MQSYQMRCKHSSCENKVYKQTGKCILHCKKSDFSETDGKIALGVFHEALLNYIKGKAYIDGNSVLHDENSVANNLQHRKNTDYTVRFDSIVFPMMYANVIWNYSELLNRLKNIYFIKCEFYDSDIMLDTPNMSFEQCVFHNHLYSPICKTPDSGQDILYRECDFKSGVNVEGEYGGESTIADTLFFNCNFNDNEVIISNLTFNKIALQCHSKSSGLNISQLTFRRCKLNSTSIFNPGTRVNIKQILIGFCEFRDNFLIDSLNCAAVEIVSCGFESPVSFRNNSVLNINLNSCKFKSEFSLFDKVGSLVVKECEFQSFVNFESCEFGINDSACAIFYSVSFKGSVNFRGTHFKKGLDLDRATFTDAPNFFGCEIDEKNTTRETFRIIKNSFDKVGNYVDGNRYYACEASKIWDESKWIHPRKYVLLFNLISSNFGQFYWLPIIWIFVLTSIYYIFSVLIGSEKVLACIKNINFLCGLHNFLNESVRLVFRDSKIIIKEFEFISLVTHVLYASLLWQTIVCIKRHTKR